MVQHKEYRYNSKLKLHRQAHQEDNKLHQAVRHQHPVKTRSLRDIYEYGTTNSFSLFALFSQIDHPLTFEEFIEEEVWAQAMDEEMECIEKNQTW